MHTGDDTVRLNYTSRFVRVVYGSVTRILIELSRIAFPIMVSPEDDRTSFVQEVPRDLQYLTIILAICASVDESKCLDIPILGFFNNL